MTRLRRSIPLATVLAAGAVLYRSCLDGYFLADDFGYLQLFSKTSLRQFLSLFTSDWSQGIWGFNLQELRPLTGFTYWLDFRVWGANALGYHLESLILYALAVAGLFFFITEAARGFSSSYTPPDAAIRWSAALGAFLFLVHPAHVEAVAWIAGRTDLLGGVAYLWAMYCLARFWRERTLTLAIAGIVIFGAGLFAKENVITLPLAFLLYAACAGNLKNSWKRLLATAAPLALLAALWVGLRLIAFESIGRAANVAGIRGFLARLPYYASQTLPMIPTSSVMLLALLLVACLVYGVYRWSTGGCAIIFWGVCWTVVTLLPLIAVAYESPRHIFLALAGPLTALSSAVAMFSPRRRLVPMAAMALCLTLAFQFAMRTRQWLPVWKESSTYSRQLLELLGTGRYASDAVVVVNSGPSLPIFFWQWALPFAVERPFMDFPARIVATPDWYCCPEWQARRESILKEVASGVVKRVHRIEFNPATHRFEER